MKTYDVQFDDDARSISKGFELSYDACKAFIELKFDDYFEDFIGGSVSIVDNYGNLCYTERITQEEVECLETYEAE